MLNTTQKETLGGNAYYRVHLALQMINNQQTQRFNAFFEPHGITPLQFNVLQILLETYPDTCHLFNVKSKILCSNSDVSRVLERLIASGLVVRNFNAKDKRFADIVLTEKGLELVKKLTPEVNKLWKLDNLSEKDAEGTAALLEKVLGL